MKRVIFKNNEDLKYYLQNVCKGDFAKFHEMKCASMKTADSPYIPFVKEVLAINADTDEAIVKSGVLNYTAKEEDTEPSFLVRAIINTTGLLDSHGDVHIKGIWNKTLNEQNGTGKIMHLQEHRNDFAHLITRNVDASAKTVKWTKLGYSFEGSTQALVFDSDLSNTKNEFMKDMYRSGDVTNHSVGMYYVKGILCVDSDDEYFKEEKKNFDKYISHVVNKEALAEIGHFYAVTEAKVIEGSAVLNGSNYATPTMFVQEKNAETIEPSDDTHGGGDNANSGEPSSDTQEGATNDNEPSADTQKTRTANYTQLAKHFTLKK